MSAILGGGISGLSAAYYALENPQISNIVLYEASSRLGGWINSKKTKTGTVFEKGPRTIRPVGPAGQNTLNLAHKLGLDDHVIPIRREHPATQNRLIYVNKKLHLLPTSFSSLFSINSPFERRLISLFWNDLNAKKGVNNDESIYSFAERRFGKDIADYLISPMICGICAGNAKDISVKFLLQAAFDLEQKYGSVTKGLFYNILSKLFRKNSGTKLNIPESPLAKQATYQKWSCWCLKGGLEQIPVKLAEKLNSNNSVEIFKEHKCEQMTFKSDYVELLVNGKTEKYRNVISSLLGKDLAPLLRRQHSQLSRELEAIPSVNVAVINFKYNENILPLEAFGLLVAPTEKLPVLGIIFDSCLHKTDDSTVITIMMGGAWYQEYFNNASEEYLLSVAQSQVKNILNTKADPIEYDVAILKNCIPQYVVGHSERLQRIRNYISAHKLPLELCGSSYQGVGLNDVILSAKDAVSHIK